MPLMMNQFGPSPSRLRHLSTLKSISPALVSMAFAEWESMQLELAIMNHDLQMLKIEAEARHRKHAVCATTDDPEHKVLYPLGIWNPKNRPRP